MATVGELFPRFCAELQDLIGTAGRADLVECVPHLRVVSRCTCGEANCAHFYTAEPPSGGYGAAHSNLVLASHAGHVALDLLHSTIVAVEILDRPDVKAKLDAWMPLPRAKQSNRLACPVCGFYTVADSCYGSYNICDVCEWEDDGVQLANPACTGGANSVSLVDAQLAALDLFPLATREVAGFQRSATWRPLNAREIALANVQREEKYWFNKAVVAPDETYWVKDPA